MYICLVKLCIFSQFRMSVKAEEGGTVSWSCSTKTRVVLIDVFQFSTGIKFHF